MIINEAFHCYCRKTKCLIIDGLIKPYPFSIDNRLEIIDPFEENNRNQIPLYLVFASIQTENDIIKFIEKYGFLGLKFEMLNNKNWLEYTTTILKDISYLNTYFENVEGFLLEVNLMKSIVELINEFNNNTLQIDIIQKTLSEDKLNELDKMVDYSKLKEKISNVYKYNNRNMNDDIIKASAHPRLVAPDLIIKELEIKLSSIILRLVYEKRKFIESRFVYNLLTALYLMLYEDLTTGKKLAKCNNKTCNSWFLIDTNHKKQYCSPECERAEKQRRYRENKKKIINLKPNNEKGD